MNLKETTKASVEPILGSMHEVSVFFEMMASIWKGAYHESKLAFEMFYDRNLPEEDKEHLMKTYALKHNIPVPSFTVHRQEVETPQEPARPVKQERKPTAEKAPRELSKNEKAIVKAFEDNNNDWMHPLDLYKALPYDIRPVEVKEIGEWLNEGVNNGLLMRIIKDDDQVLFALNRNHKPVKVRKMSIRTWAKNYIAPFIDNRQTLRKRDINADFAKEYPEANINTIAATLSHLKSDGEIVIDTFGDLYNRVYKFKKGPNWVEQGQERNPDRVDLRKLNNTQKMQYSLTGKYDPKAPKLVFDKVEDKTEFEDLAQKAEATPVVEAIEEQIQAPASTPEVEEVIPEPAALTLEPEPVEEPKPEPAAAAAVVLAKPKKPAARKGTLLSYMTDIIFSDYLGTGEPVRRSVINERIAKEWGVADRSQVANVLATMRKHLCDIETIGSTTNISYIFKPKPESNDTAA